MHHISRLLLVAVVVICGVSASSDVLTLDTASFDETVAAHKLIAIEFYAPWCGHCKNLAPEWEKAATALKGKVAVAKVDCTVEESVCKKYEVNGYPTLKLFRDGEAEELDVGRNAPAIIAHLEAELLPAVTKATSEAEVTAFQQRPFSLVGYFDSESSPAYELFSSVAAKHKTSVPAAAVVGESWNTKKDVIVMRRDFEPNEVTFDGELTAEALTSWIIREQLPLVSEINGNTFQKFLATKLPIAYLFINPKDDNSALLEAYKTAISSLKSKVLGAWIDFSQYAQHGTRMGLSGTTVPSFVVDDHNANSRYVHAESPALTAESLTQWLKDFAAGTIKKFIKSEPVPEQTGHVYTLVHDNFEEIVLDETKHVLVEFYAPWCGHCKKLAPIWEELGEALKDEPTVRIAKIDATANDLPISLPIKGYPTIYNFPIGKKSTPQEYQGGRTLEELEQFVRSNAGLASEEVIHDEL